MVRLGPVLGMALGVLSGGSRADARAVQDERYATELAWNAAVRLLRVDFGFTIVERDRDTGFLLFTYREPGRSTPGSLEIVPAQVEGAAGTRIIVQLPQMPSYAERHILSRLSRKLREDYGEPPAPPRREPPRPPSDEGRPGTPAEGGAPPPRQPTAPAR